MASPTAIPYLPEKGGLPTLRAAAASCRGCDLYENATQTVFGEGTRTARVMFVGEQPGDREDLRGKPFVGPAGRLLDRGLERAGIARSDAYITNLVKHFKWKPKGKRRIHQKPNADEIMACRPWLDEELAKVDPEIVVCLGSTPAKALISRTFRVTEERATLIEWGGRLITATVHPASVLRAQGDEGRREAREGFYRDLASIARNL